MRIRPRSLRLKKLTVSAVSPPTVAETKVILETSAKENRNLLIVFIAYLTTAFILCLSVSDLDLLVGTKNVQIPLLSIALPMWAFYTFIPTILLLLHYDLIDNSIEHDKKLKAWLAFKPKDPSAQMYPFILDFARVSYGSVLKPTKAVAIRAAFVWLLYVGLPLFVLTTYMVHFARLQENATLFHMALIALDLSLIYRLQFRIRDIDCKSHTSAIRSKRVFYGALFCWGLTVFLLWLLIQVVHKSSKGPGYFSARVVYGRAVEWVLYAIRLEEAVNSQIGLRFVPRLVIRNARPYLVERDELYSSDVALGVSSKSEKRMQFKPARNGFEWTSKQILFADLTGSEFQLAAIHDVDGQWANFFRANVEGSLITNSDFTGANFTGAEFSGVSIADTKLHGSTFSMAGLRGDTLERSHCHFCNFSGSDLDSSTLRDSYFSGSSFSNAFWGYSRIVNNDMRGCNFDRTTLSGSFFAFSTGFQFVGSSWVGIRNSDLVDVRLFSRVPVALASSSNNLRFLVGWQEIAAGFGRREQELHELKARGSVILALTKEFDLGIENSKGEVFFLNDMWRNIRIPFVEQAKVLQAVKARVCRDWWTTRGMLWNGHDELRAYVRDEPKCEKYSELLHGFKTIGETADPSYPLGFGLLESPEKLLSNSLEQFLSNRFSEIAINN
jgi:uncharacterized protein YjbI with pentapeptide repeats